MAKPEIQGSYQEEGYSAANIDIIHEDLRIKLLDINRAHFSVEYTIQSSNPGFSMPLMFDGMMNGLDDFKVWMDGAEVRVLDSPSLYNDDYLALWKDSLRTNFGIDYIPLIDQFRYFIVDMAPGVHSIKVEYVAQATINQWRMVNTYTFLYNLEPARSWKSFNQLDLTIDASGISGVTDMMLDGKMIQLDSLKTWSFNSLPQTGIVITCTPRISSFAQCLIDNDGVFLFVVFVLIALLHVWCMWLYRKRNPKRKFSLAMFWGSWITVFLMCVFYMYHFSITDFFIGEHASERHGYVFLIFLVYPFFLMFYLVMAFALDQLMKKKVDRKDVKLEK